MKTNFVRIANFVLHILITAFFAFMTYQSIVALRASGAIEGMNRTLDQVVLAIFIGLLLSQAGNAAISYFEMRDHRRVNPMTWLWANIFTFIVVFGILVIGFMLFKFSYNPLTLGCLLVTLLYVFLGWNRFKMVPNDGFVTPAPTSQPSTQEIPLPPLNSGNQTPYNPNLTTSDQPQTFYEHNDQQGA